MTNWRKQVQLGDEFELFDSEGFEAARDAAVTKLRAELPEAPGHIIGQMAKSKTERGLNAALDKLYDWADVNLVWVQTW